MDEWFKECPPKRMDIHWKDGRSAKELARYMTRNFPKIPQELFCILNNYASSDEILIAPEYVTNFESKGFGKGEGRNHDSLILMRDSIIGIEAKVDEEFGQYYSSINKKTDNQKSRYEGLYNALFNSAFDGMIKYQLVTASVGTILEAIDRKKQNAVLLIVTFLKDGHYSERKVNENVQDLQYFIQKFVKKSDGSLMAKLALDNHVNFFIDHLNIKLGTD